MAQAETEFRARFSLLAANPSAVNEALAPYPETKTLRSYGADLIFTLPSMPVGLGGRYEKFFAQQSNSIGESAADWTRVSILINSRIVDEDYYLGPIATIGVSNQFRYTTTPTGSPSLEYKSDGNLSGTLAAEAGYKFSNWILGGELGYMYAPLGDLKDSSGQSVQNSGGGGVTTDLGGFYLSLSAGLTF